MKKLISLALASALLCSLCACGLSGGDSAESIEKYASQEYEGTTVTQECLSGSISLKLPDGWTYNLCDYNSDDLCAGEYGIQFTPAGAEEGYIQICYNAAFRSYSDNLTEVTTTLGGDTAVVGYYNGSNIWDHVCYQGVNEGIVAYTQSTADWYSDNKAMIFAVLNSMVYTPADYNSLKEMKSLVNKAGAVCGVGYLGPYSSGDPALTTTVLPENLQFILSITDVNEVIYTGNEVYCIVPGRKTASITISAYKSSKKATGQVLYYTEDSSPLLLVCNESGQKSNILITITTTDGGTISFSPSLNQKDGSIVLPEKVYAFTVE